MVTQSDETFESPAEIEHGAHSPFLFPLSYVFVMAYLVPHLVRYLETVF